MKRVSFLIDGFNLYHFINDLHRIRGVKGKWLDLKSLFSSFLYNFGREARLEKIYYFSALPEFLSSTKPETINRHKDYIKCLSDTGVGVTLGRFREKRVFCNQCKRVFIKHEEKETDVSIALKLYDILNNDEADIVVIVSGDTDLTPAVNICKLRFPKKEICFIFPYNRKMKELVKISTISCFTLNEGSYINNQFSNPYKLKSGIEIKKPDTW